MSPHHLLMGSVAALLELIYRTPGLNTGTLGLLPSNLECLLVAAMAERVAVDARNAAGDATPTPALIPRSPPPTTSASPLSYPNNLVATRNRVRVRRRKSP